MSFCVARAVIKNSLRYLSVLNFLISLQSHEKFVFVRRLLTTLLLLTGNVNIGKIHFHTFKFPYSFKLFCAIIQIKH